MQLHVGPHVRLKAQLVMAPAPQVAPPLGDMSNVLKAGVLVGLVHVAANHLRQGAWCGRQGVGVMHGCSVGAKGAGGVRNVRSLAPLAPPTHALPTNPRAW